MSNELLSPMKNDHDMGLTHLFEQTHEPVQDEIFTAKVTQKVVQFRYFYRVIQALAILTGVAILAE
jgi:hypothetical protein